MIFSLIDMLNLARTHLIPGSGWSSYSEVAAYIGGQKGKPVPILMAGRDFGTLVKKDGSSRANPKPPCCNAAPDGEQRDSEFVGNLGLETAAGANENSRQPPIVQYWPRPF